MKKWLQDFLENEPPYKSFQISANQLSELSSIEHISIEQYCSICKKSRTFKCNFNPMRSIKTECDQAIAKSYSLYRESFLKRYSNCFLLAFCCQHDCNENHYFAIKVSNLTIEKIGQFPSFAKEEIASNIREYKNVISGYYPELTRALSAYSQNMGIASFVYLRRILEHLVNKKYCENGYSKQAKFIDKIHCIEKKEQIIPDDIKEVKDEIYSVLSKGVHEYDEEECLSIFPAVLFVIERILDEEVYAAERKRKALEAKKVIQNQLNKENNNG